MRAKYIQKNHKKKPYNNLNDRKAEEAIVNGLLARLLQTVFRVLYHSLSPSSLGTLFPPYLYFILFNRQKTSEFKLRYLTDFVRLFHLHLHTFNFLPSQAFLQMAAAHLLTCWVDQHSFNEYLLARPRKPPTEPFTSCSSSFLI